MPEAASQGAGTRPTLADEAAALRKTLARNEPWTGLQGKPVEPITVHAMSMATAWNLPDGSQTTWFNNGAIRTSPRQLSDAEIDEIHHWWLNGLDAAEAGAAAGR